MCTTITKTETAIAVKAPYSSTFPAKARALGGKWDGAVWTFDVRDEERVRDLCLAEYGYDGRSAPQLATARLEFQQTYSRRCAPCTFLGRTLASASGRDSGARIGSNGVVLVAGRVTSGGSRANWETVIRAGTTLLVRDLPAATLAAWIAEAAAETPDYGTIGYCATVTIEPEAPVVDRAALAEERARLLARVAEIDAALAETPPVPGTLAADDLAALSERAI